MNTNTLIGKCALLATVLVLGLAVNGTAFAKKGGGNGGGNAGGGNGGEDEAVYSAAGNLINLPAAGYIDSTNLNFGDIIFRPSAGFTFDLSGFDVSLDPDDPLDPCDNFSDTTTGTLVLAAGDSANPGSAQLRLGFQGLLSDGSKTVQHYLVMNGTMSGDWPPSGSDTTELTFTDWSIAAENKKSQRNDCAGDGDGITVLIDMWVSTTP